MSFTFKIDTQPESVIFSIAGRINHEDTLDELIAVLGKEIDKKVKYVLLDISKLEYITSSGLNFFIRALTKTKNNGGQLLLCGMNGMVEKLFTISKLNEIFTLCPTVQAGLDKINANKA